MKIQQEAQANGNLKALDSGLLHAESSCMRDLEPLREMARRLSAEMADLQAKANDLAKEARELMQCPESLVWNSAIPALRRQEPGQGRP